MGRILECDGRICCKNQLSGMRVIACQINDSRPVGRLFQPEHIGDGQTVSELGGTASDSGRRAADSLQRHATSEGRDRRHS